MSRKKYVYYFCFLVFFFLINDFVIVMGNRWTEEEVNDEIKKLGYTLLERGRLERYLGELITTDGSDSHDFEKVLQKARKEVHRWSTCSNLSGLGAL